MLVGISPNVIFDSVGNSSDDDSEGSEAEPKKPPLLLPWPQAIYALVADLSFCLRGAKATAQRLPGGEVQRTVVGLHSSPC